MSGLAIITEACIDVKDRACVDVCPVQCIYEFDPKNNALFSEDEAGTACYQPDVCPVGAIYSEENVPDGASKTHYNREDPNKGHDHSFFIQLSRDVFAD
jgi:Fe-S-cluster-containing hydrogenase component 2